MAKMAMYSILKAMKAGSMRPFNLDMIVGIEVLDNDTITEDPDFAAEMAFTAGTKFGYWTWIVAVRIPRVFLMKPARVARPCIALTVCSAWIVHLVAYGTG